MATLQSASQSSRVVHRRRRAQPAPDQTCDTAVSELPSELHPLVIQYAANLREGTEIRSALSTAMSPRWTVDNVARRLI
jgi:hypothetical protein